MVVTKGGYWGVMVVLLPGATSRIIQGHRVRYFWRRVSNFNLSEAKKQCFLASDLLQFGTFPQGHRTF